MSNTCARTTPPQGLTLPDVVLVRKSYEERRRRRRARGDQQRAWRLKRLAVDVGEEEAAAQKAAAQQPHHGRGMSSLEQEQADLERFMQVGWGFGLAGSAVHSPVCGGGEAA